MVTGASFYPGCARCWYEAEAAKVGRSPAPLFLPQSALIRGALGIDCHQFSLSNEWLLYRTQLLHSLQVVKERHLSFLGRSEVTSPGVSHLTPLSTVLISNGESTRCYPKVLLSKFKHRLLSARGGDLFFMKTTGVFVSHSFFRGITLYRSVSPGTTNS